MTDNRHFLGRSKKDLGAPVPPPKNVLPTDYGDFLQSVKTHIAGERLKAILSANTALILLYWDLGNLILAKQDAEQWGSKVIDRLSHDLKEAFPEMSGFSPRNLKYMRKFAGAWPDRAIVQRTIAQIPWSSNLLLLEKLQNPETRLFYAEKTHAHRWSKVVLAHQISAGLHEREGKLTNNFGVALPPKGSDLAVQKKVSEMMTWASGSARSFFRKGDFKTHEILAPSENLLKAFEDQVIPMFLGISNNSSESETLVKLRDTLLPKFISDALRLAETEQLPKEALA